MPQLIEDRVEINLVLLLKIEAVERALDDLDRELKGNSKDEGRIQELRESVCVEARSAYTEWRWLTESRRIRVASEFKVMKSILEAAKAALKGSEFEKAVENRFQRLLECEYPLV